MRPTAIAQHWAKDATELVGKTPLVQLQRIVPDLPATLLAKLEMFSPGGSLKDRVALQMICDAENQGLLRAGHKIGRASCRKECRDRCRPSHKRNKKQG